MQFPNRTMLNNNGSLFKIIVAPEGVNTKLGWPFNIYIHPNGNIVAGYDGPQKFFFDESGSLINKIDVFGDAFSVSQGFIFYVQKNKYDLYSPTGQLLQTYKERPLELGQVTENRLKSGNYRVTVKYPDREWTIIRGPSGTMRYMRDLNGRLHAVGNTTIIRYDDCGKEIARLKMPVVKYQPGEASTDLPEDSEVPNADVLEESGQPVLATNGDVYTWKRTPDKYSTIKWTWTDDPNAPSGPDAPTELAVTSATNGLSLTWKASSQDPGCVTGYEVARSSTSGGTLNTVGSTAKKVLNYSDPSASVGTTYYYNVRAVAGGKYSPYSNEASGKRE